MPEECTVILLVFKDGRTNFTCRFDHVASDKTIIEWFGWSGIKAERDGELDDMRCFVDRSMDCRWIAYDHSRSKKYTRVVTAGPVAGWTDHIWDHVVPEEDVVHWFNSMGLEVELVPAPDENPPRTYVRAVDRSAMWVIKNDDERWEPVTITVSVS